MALSAGGSRPISIAIVAMGGQGGGVLSDWIVSVAEHAGYLVQATSVPGVAQRTGATVYYLELFPGAEAAGRDPVMALMPVPGDVDVVIAGELVEAGRAITRGFVSPGRTTLIASAHRDYALTEKMALGDGRADAARILESAGEHARRLVCFDMAARAEDTGSVISAVLFGALAGAQVLPFAREDFEAAIRRGAVAVEANLRGFASGLDRARAALAGETEPEAPEPAPAGARRAGDPGVQALLDRIEGDFPEPAREVLTEGARRLLDYQDARYAGEYLGRLEQVRALDAAHGGAAEGWRLTVETGRYLALWMSYEDVIRVADLKTRSRRLERVRREVRAAPDQIVHVTEFMHPRAEEICDTLPAPLGALVLGTPPLRAGLGLLCRRGRQVRTSSLPGFMLLYTLAGLRRWRRWTYRFKHEHARIDAWLATIARTVPEDYALACEIAECQRLVKGYGDTHERGLRNYDRIMQALDRIRARGDPARTVKELRAAALADERGETLERMMKQVA